MIKVSNEVNKCKLFILDRYNHLTTKHPSNIINLQRVPFVGTLSAINTQLKVLVYKWFRRPEGYTKCQPHIPHLKKI